ncbi:DNA translocase FtsK [Methylocapsa sp. D3K7]|uniref:DNA translocase FtsK n=1 Tax=Methylocapsa sp. D3K7 TaxID=3041435 RepID=UPI00244E6D3C|nr:DNA translocase FtsK [Methylocapsa sp. D3K7]WGJ15401.1 DNA translocase FtsK [Methylocapsa sp. D3K7]
MRTTTNFSVLDHIPDALREFLMRRGAELAGIGLIGFSAAIALALASWSVLDPSFNHAAPGQVHNLLGAPGAIAADLIMQMLGVSALAFLAPMCLWGWRLIFSGRLERAQARLGLWIAGGILAAGLASLLPVTARWPLPTGLGGVAGDAILAIPSRLLAGSGTAMLVFTAILAVGAILCLSACVSLRDYRSDDSGDDADTMVTRRGVMPAEDLDAAGEPGTALILLGAVLHAGLSLKAAVARQIARRRAPPAMPQPLAMRDHDGFFDRPLDLSVEPLHWPQLEPENSSFDPSAYAPPATREAIGTQTRQKPDVDIYAPRRVIAPAAAALKPGSRALKETQPSLLDRLARQNYLLPPLHILAEPRNSAASKVSEDALSQNARLLEGVLEDFGVKGEIVHVRPGPVVTLYELEPAPGIKSSRVIGLADDIARSMSALSARVAVVQGRNAIGIELPNQRRETVFLRELLGSQDFEKTKHQLAIALGKTIGGEPIIVDLARMPHLLVAGTTGSGKSVAINTMILSLLYRLKPEECRLIMVDPKMLELSVYDGIPHLLTPVVTDPKKAVVALKWAVREMEDRYKKMSKLGVRNIEGFNARVTEANAKGETLMRTVQTGYDRETGEAIYEQEAMELSVLPFIVVIVDEMADLMMVAGKDIEGAIQRLAQMARAAGIHLIMATQRPSVDVITGTIKANFPTRISFQVTSKIDSRTILGEQGAEQLLGQGDMLYMAGGGRISRVHGPFVADGEVEKIVAHLKTQGQPEYLEAITSEDDASEEDAAAPAPGSMDAEEAGDLYDRAVNIVLRDKKCSTSYIQRRLSVGYNKAASLVERMEKEGVVGAPNHSGKRAILVGGGIDRGAFDVAAEG